MYIENTSNQADQLPKSDNQQSTSGGAFYQETIEISETTITQEHLPQIDLTKFMHSVLNEICMKAVKRIVKVEGMYLEDKVFNRDSSKVEAVLKVNRTSEFLEKDRRNDVSKKTPEVITIYSSDDEKTSNSENEALKNFELSFCVNLNNFEVKAAMDSHKVQWKFVPHLEKWRARALINEGKYLGTKQAFSTPEKAFSHLFIHYSKNSELQLH